MPQKMVVLLVSYSATKKKIENKIVQALDNIFRTFAKFQNSRYSTWIADRTKTHKELSIFKQKSKIDATIHAQYAY